MEGYTDEQREFLNLIKIVFNINEREQQSIFYLDFQGANTTQAEIAAKLGIDPSQFSKMLKPGYVSSLGKHIKRLRHLKELKDIQETRKEVSLLQLEVSKLRKAKKTNRNIALLFGAMFILLAGDFWFLLKIQEPQIVASTESPASLLEDPLVLNVLELYGNNLAHQIAWEAAWTKQEINNGKPADFQINLFENAIVDKIDKEREVLEGFNFVSQNGSSLVDYIKESITKEMQIRDIRTIHKYILDERLSPENIRRYIEFYVSCLQDQSLRNMKIMLQHPDKSDWINQIDTSNTCITSTNSLIAQEAE